MGWLDNPASLAGWLAINIDNPTQFGNIAQQDISNIEGLGSWLQYALAQGEAPRAHGAPFAGYGQDTAGAPLTLESAAGDIWSWLNTGLPRAQQQQRQSQQQGQRAGQKAGRKAQIPSLAGMKLPAGADPTTVAAVIKAAQDTGVDPALALAIAFRESGLNNQQGSDGGRSYGPFQLNVEGGEGTGLDSATLADPYQTSLIALRQIKQTIDANPGMSAGDIAVRAQRPQEDLAAGYAQDINNYFDSIQTGSGALGGLGPAIGLRGGAASRAPYGTANVPQPFPSNLFFQNITERFQEEPSEWGNDIAMDPGTAIISPVGGTISTEDDGKANWGKRVFVTTPSGWKVAIGHMHSFAVADGQHVQPGDTLGESGGALDDPSSGNSTGPHIEFQIIDPNGRFQDPYPALAQIYGQNATFSNWMGGVFQSSAGVKGDPQNLTRTPDGRLLNLNTPQGQWYANVDAQWSAIYGVHAPLAVSDTIRASGVTTIDQLKVLMQQMPGPVKGFTVGQYQTVSNSANSQAQTRWGRSVPDSLTAQLLREGITGANDINLWFDSHSSNDIPAGEYQSAYDAAQSATQSLYGDVPHPSDVSKIWSGAHGSPFDETLLHFLVVQHYGDKPHPDAPEIKVKDYNTFYRVAAQINFTAKPNPVQVSQAYNALRGAGISPAEFERVWTTAMPMATRLLNHPPTIHDITALQHQMPEQIYHYFMNSPHPNFPEVTAGDMIRYWHASQPISKQIWNRDPNEKEVARFALAHYDATDILAHYQSDGTEFLPDQPLMGVSNARQVKAKVVGSSPAKPQLQASNG